METPAQHTDPELIQLPEPVIIQRGEKYLEEQKKLDQMVEDLAFMQVIMEDRDAFKKENEDLKKELERLRTQALENSIAIQVAQKHHQEQKAKIDTLSYHLKKFLDEFEGEWMVTKSCTSVAIAEDYVRAAAYMRDVFKREGDYVEEVREWIDSDNLPFNIVA